MLTLDNRELIARGRTAEIYAWNTGTVLKLYYDWLPSGWIDREARVARTIATSSVPSAKLIDDVFVSNRRGLIFERIDGPSMLRLMSSKPWLMNRQAAIFAKLHFMIHNQPGEGLPQVRMGIRDAIDEVQILRPALKVFVLRMLDSLPDGDSLCHYDFHPDQIVITRSGPRILDWMTAFQGSPMADVARTSVLSTLGAIPPHINFVIRSLTYVARGSFYRRYLREYLELNQQADSEMIKRWMIPVAAARLRENIPGDSRTILPFLEHSMLAARWQEGSRQ